MKNTKPRCSFCGRWISHKDFDEGLATHHIIIPDSDLTTEQWETKCKRCRKKGTLVEVLKEIYD
jgi:hypothetical protein